MKGCPADFQKEHLDIHKHLLMLEKQSYDFVRYQSDILTSSDEEEVASEKSEDEDEESCDDDAVHTWTTKDHKALDYLLGAIPCMPEIAPLLQLQPGETGERSSHHSR